MRSSRHCARLRNRCERSGLPGSNTFSIPGAKRGVALAANNLGDLYWADGDGDRDEALMHWRRALRLYDEIGDQRGVATVLRNLGEACMLQREYDEAEPLLRRARALATELDDEEILNAVDRELANLWAATRANAA